MSGLKCYAGCEITPEEKSHPVWDEWIEILRRIICRTFSLRLIPFGMSGLKFPSADKI